jgi:nucleotide-binding universal stress UspA family protein
MLDAAARIEDIVTVTGVTVRKAEIRDVDPVDGVARYLATHKPDLVVMATHGRTGLNRWLKGSVSAQIAQETLVPTLLLGPHARSLVDEKTGSLEFRRVLVPVDDHPPAGRGLARLRDLLSDMEIELDLVHVGDTPLELADEDAVRQLEGPVIEAILAEAENADLVAMPTAGPHGMLEALRGSTTEQVVRDSPRPVLALPTRTD